MGPKRKQPLQKPSSSKSRKERSPTDLSVPTPPSDLSAISTNAEDDLSWAITKRNAGARIDQYELVGEHNRRRETILKQSLHALLEWLPPGGRDYHAKIIRDAKTDYEIWKHFESVCCHLAAPMKAVTSSISKSSGPQDNMTDHARVVADTITDPQARVPEFPQTLARRDDHRCVITGHMSFDRWREIGGPDDSAANLVGAHIISFAYASWKTPVVKTRRSNAWVMLYESFPTLERVIHSTSINHPSNGITLRHDLHTFFGGFKLAFQATGQPHEYHVRVFGDVSHYALKDFLDPITLRNAASDEEGIALPDPALLDCHYRIANILHASGMGETVEKLMREWDDLKQGPGCHGLREDGKTDVETFLSAGLWDCVNG